MRDASRVDIRAINSYLYKEPPEKGGFLVSQSINRTTCKKRVFSMV